ncbi:TonB-dependent receptor plug [Filimonas lacunae]|nr:TonB-dependent receptor plug [Filimonas lacunae]
MLLLLLCTGVNVLAQSTFSVKGKITDSTGVAIGNVSIKEKNQKRGTTSKDDGSFLLSVSGSNAVLIISSIGYEEQEVPVQGKANVVVMLQRSTEQLSDIVVTALGVKRDKRNLTFSSQVVQGAEVNKAQEPNVLNALTGKAAGVQITSTTGAPGSSAAIVIRGVTSLSGDNQALIVLDGVPMNNDETDGGGGGGAGGNRLSDLDPSVIDNINILKGAAATALYGSAGARGVVLITTKGGSKGKKPVVTLSSSLSLETPHLAPRQLLYSQGNNGQYIDGETQKSSYSWGARMDTLHDASGNKVQFHNPMKEFFKTGITNNNTISVAGGNNQSDYFISYSYFKQKGTVPNTDLSRHSLFTKYHTQVYDKLSATFELTYSNATKNFIDEGYGLQNPITNVYISPVSYNLKNYLNADGTQRLFRYNRNNPYWVLNNIGNHSNINRFMPQVNLVYTPASWLSVTERVGADIYMDLLNYHINKGDISFSDGKVYTNNTTFKQFNHDLIVQLKQQFGKFNTSLMLGNNVWSRYYNYMSATGTGLSKAGYYNMASAASVSYAESKYDQRKVGFYAQAEVDYNRLLILSLSGRYDGSSVLSTSNAFYPYGSAAVGFIFSELLDAQTKKIINFGKLRASYASVGNDNVTVYANSTPYVQVTNANTGANVTFPYAGVNGFALSSNLGNSQLKNELQKEFEVGLETKLLGNRLGLEASYFNRNMSQGLVSGISLAPSTGYSTTTINSAEINTKGVELLLNGTPVKTRNFSWDVTVNFTKLNTKVKEVAPGKLDETQIGFTYAVKGMPYGMFYGSVYARNAQGELLLKNGLPYSESNDYLGTATPDWTGGITNQFHYKNFALSFFIDTRQGGMLQNVDEYYNLTYGVSKATENRADRIIKGIDAATGAANTTVVTAQSYFTTISGITESQMQKASYIKLRNVSFSYSLNKSLLVKTPFKEATITFTGRNLWIHKAAGFTGSDPESTNTFGTSNGNMGVYTFGTPTSRSYGCSLKFVF